MPKLNIRKRLLIKEEIFHEGGPVKDDSGIDASEIDGSEVDSPLYRAAALTVVENPFAGSYHENIADFMDDLKPLGMEMAQQLIDALGGDPDLIEGYGKGSIAGAAGELEHAALWHVPGGLAMREKLSAKAIVPSTKKVGGVGVRLDVPTTHINASFVRSHYDAMEVGLADGPLADELVFVLVMSTGPRIHARVGGLKASEIKGEDGLR